MTNSGMALSNPIGLTPDYTVENTQVIQVFTTLHSSASASIFE